MAKKLVRKTIKGSLEKRGSVYIARWMADGKRYSRSTGETDKDEAEKLLKKWTAPFRLDNETERLKVIESRMTQANMELAKALESMPGMVLADAWKEFVDAPKGKTLRGRAINPTGRTLEDYKAKWLAFINWVKTTHPKKDEEGRDRHIEMREITPEIGHQYIRHIESHFSLNTRNKTITLLRLIFSVLALKSRMTVNPFADEVTTKAPPRRKRALTTSELAEVSSVLENSGDRELELLFAMGYYLGARRGDCALMRWASIDMDGRVIRYTPRKTERHNSEEIATGISEELFTLLTRIPKSKRKGYAMPGIAELYLADAPALSRRIQNVFITAGIETTVEATETRAKDVALVGFHSLRHTRITRLLSSGIPMETVRKQAGHSTIGMTAHYFHESEETRDRITSVMAPMKALPSPMDSTEAILEAFLAIVDKLNTEQLTKVKKRLASALAPRKK